VLGDHELADEDPRSLAVIGDRYPDARLQPSCDRWAEMLWARSVGRQGRRVGFAKGALASELGGDDCVSFFGGGGAGRPVCLSEDRPVCQQIDSPRMAEVLNADEGLARGPRQRILDSAYDLFSRRGIRAVGVDEVIERAAVAKATLYRHFPSKDDLVLAFLERREQLWTRELVEAEARRRGATPEDSLLAIFDVFHEWFQQDDFEGCSFINVLLETADRKHPVGAASALHLENIRSIVRTLAEEAGLRDPAGFALSWHILMKGSIVQAAEGDREAAQRAKSIARLLLDQYR
jgi:AcrR family transcriptional regulator